MKLKSNLSLLSSLGPLHQHLLLFLFLHLAPLVQHLQLAQLLLLVSSHLQFSGYAGYEVLAFLCVLDNLLLNGLETFLHFRNISNLFSVSSLRALSSFSLHPLALPQQLSDALRRDQFQLNQLFPEQLHKLLAF